MRENILGLYETFLGRFKFFQQFIKLLLGLYGEIESLKILLKLREDELVENKVILTSLENRLEELEIQVATFEPKKPSAPHNFNRTGTDILDSVYNKYMEANYPLEDK